MKGQAQSVGQNATEKGMGARPSSANYLFIFKPDSADAPYKGGAAEFFSEAHRSARVIGSLRAKDELKFGSPTAVRSCRRPPKVRKLFVHLRARSCRCPRTKGGPRNFSVRHTAPQGLSAVCRQRMSLNLTLALQHPAEVSPCPIERGVDLPCDSARGTHLRGSRRSTLRHSFSVGRKDLADRSQEHEDDDEDYERSGFYGFRACGEGGIK